MSDWGEKETKFLQDNYRKLSVPELAQKLNRGYNSVEHKLRALGLVNPGGDKENGGLQDGQTVKKGEESTNLIQLIGTEVVQKFRPIKMPDYNPIKPIARHEEASILDLSDVHIGMVNKIYDGKEGREITTYNFEIFKNYIQKLVEAVRDIHKILSPSYVLKDLYINVLGDIITNDRIFPEQVFEIEKVVGLQVWDAVNYLTWFINEMKRFYSTITVTCVVGNHGRSMPNFYSEPTQNNFEYFIYKVLEKQFAGDKRVKIIVPETRQYIIKIMGHPHLLEHGDGFRGASENTIEKQIKDLFVNVGEFEVLDIGHFHKLKEREMADKVIVKQNGCWIYKDAWVRKMFHDYSIPKQWFYGCNAKRAETWAYKIDFRG